MSNELSIKGYFSQDNVKAKFAEIMGANSNAFVTSVLSTVTQNKLLAKAEPQSIYMAAMMAAVLNLPVNQSLGCTYIVPYGDKAQFQLGYKGLIQLALRSGQFKTIDAKPVFEGQIEVNDDSFGGYRFTWSKKSGDKVIGYAAYFSLINGFEKMHYLSIEEVIAHGKKFSKTFNNGPWKTDFDAMACKTVLKQLLDKYAPKSVEMQRAQIADQAIINDVETMDIDYADNGQALPNYDDMKREIESNLIDNDYAWKKGEIERINEVLETNEETSYSKVLMLMGQRIITREEA